MPRFLYLRTYILRFLQTLGRYCDLYLSTPLPQAPTFTRKIKSTVGSCPGEFELLFYTPPGYADLGNNEKLPLLVNFHGGGYTIGHAADDARFITAIQSRTPCIAVSVNYRLAPEFPFPTGISDCVSALLYLWSTPIASSLHIDTSRTALSGFSAGGQFCFTSSYMLHQQIGKLRNEGKIEETDIGKLVGVCTFYAPADWTKSRADRAKSNPLTQPLSRIPGLFFGMFEQAYFLSFSRPQMRRTDLDMADPLLSPGLASEEMIKEALPENLCMMTCEWDSLLVEGETFKERLKGVGKRVEGCVVKEVPHGWDKWPSWFWPFGGGERKRDEAYKYCGEMLREFWS
ncbi:alpha/beta-hydrolase [Mollisia scopiformis]|uniref:Alpha/beta-hydrolase n=1 Tax=Mollisia scopiformis TaxID=149040 RepID=A0A194X646_MOLSC|nr:alpha/beta-hydrolase [Mollisia scopiformis]KUJ15282.1 alpha/beta-hydrolase [Mollisia scopiformis]